MKTIIVTLVMLLTQISLADDTKVSAFSEILTRHYEMVDNLGESFIWAEVLQHEGYTELGEVMEQVSKDLGEGLEGIELKPIYGKAHKRKDKVMDLLLYDEVPYFCWTMAVDNNIWDIDARECAAKTSTLLGDELEKADSVYVLDAYGDYYGSWQEIIVIMQNNDTAESLIMRFDIIHEI